MCNAEVMVVAKLAQKTIEEAALAAERDAARDAHGLAMSAEGIRRSEEEQSVIEWSDTEMRKIKIALGASAVVSAAAGVAIDELGQQWAAASSQLVGARASVRRKQAAAGDIREADIDGIKRYRLEKSKSAGMAEWALELGTAFIQGVRMEFDTFGTTDRTFGIPVDKWLDKANIEMLENPKATVGQYQGPTDTVPPQREHPSPLDLSRASLFAPAERTQNVSSATVLPTRGINPYTYAPYTLGYIPVE